LKTGGSSHIQLDDKVFLVVRIDAHAIDGGVWTATMSIDGVAEVAGATMSGQNTETGSLELSFGTEVGQVFDGGDKVTVDFADVRLDLD